jgi:phage terminase large subunit-like protein
VIEDERASASSSRRRRASDDWTTEEALIKANPNFGVSIDAELLADQRATRCATAQAGHVPDEAPEHLGAVGEPVAQPARVEGAGRQELKIETSPASLREGLDLANVTDIASTLQGVQAPRRRRVSTTTRSGGTTCPRSVIIEDRRTSTTRAGSAKAGSPRRPAA